MKDLTRNVALSLAALSLVATAAAVNVTAQAAGAQSNKGSSTQRIVIDKDEYADRLAAMWEAECLANWTGLTTEGIRPNGSNLYGTQDPFFTDADWGAIGAGRQGADIDWANPDPCGADDDTDIEYSYMNEMVNEAGSVKLTPEQVAHMWNTNVDSFVWFSNSAADLLSQDGVLPPSTTLSAANQHRNIIDAQLTTEFFGALAPGRPDVALDIAQLPIRASAGGFATHAAQFNVLLYSLAPLVDQRKDSAEQVRWLIDEASKYLPRDSRATEIIDWVVATYDANPDEPWESLRDKIYERYQVNSVANGFKYIIKYEAAINFAAEVAQFLYGEGDLTRTIQIGTLMGWDSDNPPASLAGLIGLMRGSEYVAAELAEEGIAPTERFNAYRTRDNLPDYLPDDPAATDTFTMMGERALTLIDESVEAAGGRATASQWTIPLKSAPKDDSYEELAKVNPDVDTYLRSANNQVRRDGGKVTVSSNLTGNTALYTQDTSGYPAGRMWPTTFHGTNISVVADGFDHDTRGLEEWNRSSFFAGTAGSSKPQVTVTYNRTVEAESIRLIGGGVDTSGGWIIGATVEVLNSRNKWSTVPVRASEAFDPAQPFQQVDLDFGDDLDIRGFRVTFTTSDGHLSLTEVDAMGESNLSFDGFEDDRR
ncbi:ADP-ribosylglycohydrolase family protein [Jiangella alkaliphila]|uniref:ADP-ribosylglycohydrolase n=1 Tax=Jiangella alkaliphila TaxID=419479 RepID=A0A1H2LDE2_9ACTN|nr:ADP-ribosylglycohydrolase family protein [Jiangella alkaliphila]SDU79013.1 ADP-ribosylglycohydrolase [Jiangella alkaliphila]